MNKEQDWRQSGGEAGFTLVEVLIAIVVLVVGLIGVSNLMLVAASSNSVGNQMTAATAAASWTLESLKATPYTALVIGGTVADDTQCPLFCRDDLVPGVAVIHTRWAIEATGDTQVRFIRVRSEGTGALSGQRSRAEFTTFRACTATDLGCPN